VPKSQADAGTAHSCGFKRQMNVFFGCDGPGGLRRRSSAGHQDRKSGIWKTAATNMEEEEKKMQENMQGNCLWPKSKLTRGRCLQVRGAVYKSLAFHAFERWGMSRNVDAIKGREDNRGFFGQPPLNNLSVDRPGLTERIRVYGPSCWKREEKRLISVAE
jgi:hypothetical protein